MSMQRINSECARFQNFINSGFVLHVECVSVLDRKNLKKYIYYADKDDEYYNSIIKKRFYEEN